MEQRPDPQWYVGAIGAVARRPRLWGTAVSQALRVAEPGWWRRRPFLPLPPADYLGFRLETQYGADPTMDPGDIITYLHWCRSLRRGS